MGQQASQYPELPRGLRLPFLTGLTAEALVAKCRWFVNSGQASWDKDREQHGRDAETAAYYAEVDPLCCPLPRGTAPDEGVPRGLAHWLLRLRFAEQALPQPLLATWNTRTGVSR